VTPETATFTERRHLYKDAGIVAPSVTQVLELAGIDDVSRIPLHHLQRAGAIGTAVHQATHLLDERDLELESVDEEITGYVFAWQKFKEESGFVPLKIEERGVATDGELKFGYCVDRVGLLEGELWLIDLKTASKKQPWWGIQTAGYADAIRHEGPRAAVQLTKDGKYKRLPHTREDDFERWRGALVVAHCLLEFGRKLPR
jgi:hypothetical protein